MSDPTSDNRRTDALSQLKAAQKTLHDGREELTRALEKIKAAQQLIDQSAEILRASGERHIVASRPEA